MDGVKDQHLQEIYVRLLEKYKTHENAKFDYKGSQMVLKGGCCMGASRPEGQVVSILMRQFDLFGLDYRGAWKLLMDGALFFLYLIHPVHCLQILIETLFHEF